MFKSVMVPVDLAHADALERAVGIAAGVAKEHGAALTVVGVTENTPTSVAHSPEEFAKKLEAYASDKSQSLGVEMGSKTVVSHDPAADLNEKLIETAEASGVDLVVMGSHQPGMAEHIISSHAGWVASHAPFSVLVVR